MSATVQWVLLAGLAAIGLVAVFVFGIGNTNDGTGGGHSGAPAIITTN